MSDFWSDAFMKKVRVKASGETGTIIDLGSIEDTYIVEMDHPNKEDVYPLRDYRKDELVFEPETIAV